LSLIPKNQQLITVNANQPVPAAFRVLAQNNIYSAPAQDPASGEIVGFLDLVDVVTCILQIFSDQQKKKNLQSGQHADFYKLLQEVEQFDLQNTAKVVDLSKRNPLVPVAPSTSVLEVMEIFVRTGVHRVPLMENKKVLNVLTQSTVVSYLSSHIHELGAIAHKTVGELALGMKSVVSVSSNAKAYEAFKLMATNGITSVAVVDPDDGTLLTNMSAKDVKLIVDEALFTKLHQTALEYVVAIREKQLLETVPVFSVHPETSFAKVLEKIVFLRVHRLYVVDNERKPVGVIALSDIIGAVLKNVKAQK